MNHAAFFLPAPDGQRFCIHHPGRAADARGALLYLHPFAEEMHKSRRMGALQSRALADAGHFPAVDVEKPISRVMPAVDFRVAYWLGRWAQAAPRD